GNDRQIGVGIDITERQATETALQVIKDRLELAMEVGGLAWWDWDVQTGHVAYNAHKAEMLGYDPSELDPTVDTFTAMIHPDDYDRVMHAMRDHLAGKGDYNVEYRMQTKSGDWRWFRDRGSVVERDAEGNPARLTGVVFDTTDRQRHETQPVNTEGV
ncbi:PAS domain-containing protein, partial [candidate division KSB3 bacterium]|nr:PAS domain-containing protein [candidate division KSB3 bacterium]MBD3325334.1 PAS domain-containing protein [candidate division KSB3 bacterium]